MKKGQKTIQKTVQPKKRKRNWMRSVTIGVMSIVALGMILGQFSYLIQARTTTSPAKPGEAQEINLGALTSKQLNDLNMENKKWADGNYQGQVTNNVPNGLGSFSRTQSNEKETFLGSFQNGVLTGNGTYERSVNAKTQKLSGKFENGALTGSVKLDGFDGELMFNQGVLQSVQAKDPKASTEDISKTFQNKIIKIK